MRTRGNNSFDIFVPSFLGSWRKKSRRFGLLFLRWGVNTSSEWWHSFLQRESAKRSERRWWRNLKKQVRDKAELLGCKILQTLQTSLRIWGSTVWSIFKWPGINRQFHAITTQDRKKSNFQAFKIVQNRLELVLNR